MDRTALPSPSHAFTQIPFSTKPHTTLTMRAMRQSLCFSQALRPSLFLYLKVINIRRIPPVSQSIDPDLESIFHGCKEFRPLIVAIILIVIISQKRGILSTSQILFKPAFRLGVDIAFAAKEGEQNREKYERMSRCPEDECNPDTEVVYFENLMMKSQHGCIGREGKCEPCCV
jgi:hypothetical protein